MATASLRENDETIHHISGADHIEILNTAGLLAEAINYREGRNSDEARQLSLSVVTEGFEGVFSVDEYLVWGKGCWTLVTELDSVFAA